MVKKQQLLCTIVERIADCAIRVSERSTTLRVARRMVHLRRIHHVGADVIDTQQWDERSTQLNNVNMGTTEPGHGIPKHTDG